MLSFLYIARQNKKKIVSSYPRGAFYPKITVGCESQVYTWIRQTSADVQSRSYCCYHYRFMATLFFRSLPSNCGVIVFCIDTCGYLLYSNMEWLTLGSTKEQEATTMLETTTENLCECSQPLKIQVLISFFKEKYFHMFWRLKSNESRAYLDFYKKIFLAKNLNHQCLQIGK